MKQIEINVNDKIASLVNEGQFLVCGNNDYEVVFNFDDEWSGITAKTALFVFGDEPIAMPFDGNVCEGVVIENSTLCAIGVFAGNLKTTTGACIKCVPSVRDLGNGAPKAPDTETYDKIMELLDKAMQAHTELPTGGSAGQVLKKRSDKDYDVEWVDDKTLDPNKYVPNMSVLDEKQNINDFINFTDTHNRVYVEMSRGRGTYNKYVLTTSPDLIPDPDGRSFEYGGGLYYQKLGGWHMADTSLDELVNYNLTAMYRPSTNADHSMAQFDGHKVLKLTRYGIGSEARFVFNLYSPVNTTFKKCVFEADIYYEPIMDEKILEGLWNGDYSNLRNVLRFELFSNDSATSYELFFNFAQRGADGNPANGDIGDLVPNGLNSKTNRCRIKRKEWTRVRVEQVGTTITLFINNMLVRNIIGDEFSRFDGVGITFFNRDLQYNIYIDNVVGTLVDEAEISKPQALDSVVQRYANGHIAVPTIPETSYHASSKYYVDTQLEGVQILVDNHTTHIGTLYERIAMISATSSALSSRVNGLETSLGTAQTTLAEVVDGGAFV